MFHRGRTNRGLFPEADEILGDREEGLESLGDRRWDAVIDTCGYVPRVVAASADALRDRTECYAFVSTVSVYHDPLPGTDESGALGVPPPPEVEDITAETYGPLKVACEREVIDRYGDRALILRPGLIVGPYDPTDRFTYWVARFAQGGPVAVPDDDEARLQVVDVRDLGDWTVRALEKGRRGVYNVAGPREDLTMGQFLRACRETVGSPGNELVPIARKFLEERNVQPWADLPLWVPSESGSGVLAVDRSRAIAAGLAFRSLEDTIRQTLRWHEDRGAPELTAGWSAERETELLEAWRETRP